MLFWLASVFSKDITRPAPTEMRALQAGPEVALLAEASFISASFGLNALGRPQMLLVAVVLLGR